MIKYLRRTWLNKVFALVFILLGYLSIKIDNDATFLLLAIMIGVPMFLSRENLIDL